MKLISQKCVWLCFLCLISTTIANFIIPSDIDKNDVITKREVDQMKNNLRRKWRLNLRRDPLTISDDNLIEGDILPDNYLTPEIPLTQSAQDKISVSTPTRMWHDGVVPYTFSGVYTFLPWERYMIKETMKDMEKHSCIKFVKRTTEQDYVKFIYDRNRCYSQIGRRGGMQYVSLGFLCLKLWNKSAAYHELLHVLGFFHEHTRPDRDEHVDIIWKHVKPREKKNFDKRPSHEILVDTPYDIESIMHYGPYAFSMFSYFTPTMMHKEHGISYRRLNQPSKMDYEKLNRIYLCYGQGRNGYSGIGYVGPSVEFLKEHRLPLLDPFNKDVNHYTHRLSEDIQFNSNARNSIPSTYPPTSKVPNITKSKYGSTTVAQNQITSVPLRKSLAKYLEAPNLSPGSLIPLRLPGFREAINIRQRTSQRSSMQKSRNLAPLLTSGPVSKILPPPPLTVQSPTTGDFGHKTFTRHRDTNADTRSNRRRALRRASDRPRSKERS